MLRTHTSVCQDSDMCDPAAIPVRVTVLNLRVNDFLQEEKQHATSFPPRKKTQHTKSKRRTTRVRAWWPILGVNHVSLVFPFDS